MQRIRTAALIAMLLAACIAHIPGAMPNASAADDPVKFSKPSFVDPPKVLLGDSGDGRCPPASPAQKCLQGVDDLLFGRTHVLRTDDVVFAYQGAYALFPSSNSTLPRSSAVIRALNDTSGRYSIPAVVGARMFNTQSDVAVTLVEDQQMQVLQWRIDDSDSAGTTSPLASGTIALPASQSTTSSRLAVTAGDFTGDGLDEIVVFPKGAGGITAAIVATAVNTQDPTQGLRFGPQFPLFTTSTINPMVPLSITRAIVPNVNGTTLTGSGAPQVFAAGGNVSADCPTGGLGLAVRSYSVDPDTLAITAVFPIITVATGGVSTCLQFADLTTGRFATAQHDQLLLAYGAQGGTVTVVPFDFALMGFNGTAPLVSPVQQIPFDTGLPVGTGASFIRGGRFDWSSPVDYAALLVSNAFGAQGINTLRILTYDQNFNATAWPVFQAGATSGECVADMAIGNFNNLMTNPGTPPPASIANPDLQVAIPFTDCQSTIALRIFSVARTTKQIAQLSNLNFNPSLETGSGGSVFLSALAPVDLQGRSLRVGPPTIVTVNNRLQATLILAAPPMHVDAVVPENGQAGAPPTPFNISAVPDGLFGGYSFTSSTDRTQTTTSGFTTSFSATESTDDGLTVGDCDVGDCLSASNKFSASQSVQSSQSAVSGASASGSNQLTVTTGFADLVAYQNETLTIYNYPLIGRSPATVTMAAPDTVTIYPATPGNVLPWYQPSWIPGHILSYPGNLTQLQTSAFANPADFQALSSAESWLVGPGGTATTSVTWTSGGTSGTSTNTAHTFSLDDDISVSGSVGVTDVVSGSAGLSLDFGASVGLSSLVDSVTTMSATQGISFTNTATIDDNYAYTITPFIFGKAQPPGVISGTGSAPSGTQQTFGALRTGYTVGVSDTSNGDGAFWGTWYSKAPDVALNHPERWKITKGTDLGNGTCVFSGNGNVPYDCAALGDRLPQGDVWGSTFHYMRGLFISKASTQGTPPATGPQLTTATAGDTLNLQARVYNLSLAALPPDANVMVRFMAMPWDTNANAPVSGTPSFQIGQDQVVPPSALLPFNSKGTEPNWTLVSQSFVTSGASCGGQSCANQDLLFWVVVWIQTTGSAPTLVGELPEHGLRAIPAPGQDFLEVAAGEQPFSNNLGIYNQVFHIFPASSSAPAASALPTRAGGEIGAQMTLVGAAGRSLQLGESTMLAVKVLTGGRELRAGLEVQFYDGDPLRNAPLIGLQRLPYLKAQATHDFRVRFRPQQCGQHTVYAVAGAGTRHEHTATLPTIEVKGQNCQPGGQTSPAVLTGKAEKVGSGRGNGKVSLEGTHPLGSTLDLSKASLTIERVLTEGSGGGELLRGANGAASLPQTIIARRGAKATQALFESASGAQPTFRVEVKNRDPKKPLLEIDLKAENAMIAKPSRCSASQRTSLTTRLTLNDGVHPAQVLEWTRPWECEGDRLTAR